MAVEVTFLILFHFCVSWQIACVRKAWHFQKLSQHLRAHFSEAGLLFICLRKDEHKKYLFSWRQWVDLSAVVQCLLRSCPCLRNPDPTILKTNQQNSN